MRLSISVLFGIGDVLVMKGELKTLNKAHNYNNEMLEYLLDDLMPWHRQEGLRDFSLLEVNRYNEMLMGIYMNNSLIQTYYWGERFQQRDVSSSLESREWRRQYISENNLPVEHH